jgi:hypothetical protein
LVPLSDYQYLAGQLFGAHFKFALECAYYCYRMWQGGNQWSGYDSYLSFFRHVSKLPLDYSKWQHWETLSEHSGPRVVHEKFCMISDRPRKLTVDDQNRPHCSDGPYCEWRDGSALFAWHGTNIPAKYYLREHSAAEILAEQNVEVRRCMIERYEEIRGKGRWIEDVGAKLVDSGIHRVNGEDSIVELLRVDLPDDPDGMLVAVRVLDPSTGRSYAIRVPPTQKKALSALAWTFDMSAKDYVLEQEA